jgi:hypothetical protein
MDQEVMKLGRVKRCGVQNLSELRRQLHNLVGDSIK